MRARRHRELALLSTFAFAAFALGCPARPARDVVPDSRDEVVTGDAGAAPTYEHVAERPHATVAIAESRGLDRTEVRAAAESLADGLERCARSASVSGLARVVASVGQSGAVEAVGVPVQSGDVPTLLRCVVAPTKMLVFRVDPAAARPGVALEAKWGP